MATAMPTDYDALLVLSFGGPEKPEDVIPFLENVLRGRNVPRERMLEVAEHYYHFGGRSPINEQNRELIASTAATARRRGPACARLLGQSELASLPGRHHAADAVGRYQSARLGFVTSAYSSYSGCRQYREDIARAQAEVGEGAPEIAKLPAFSAHPRFIAVNAENVQTALSEFSSPPHVAFTRSQRAADDGEHQPVCRTNSNTTTALVASKLGLKDWKLVYQSRSGPPMQPWLEPDISDHIRSVHEAGRRELVIAPIGFISDHMEVLYDLDTEAAALCEELGIRMVRATAPRAPIPSSFE